MRGYLGRNLHYIGCSFLRAVSSEYRAHTDLFVLPYCDRVDFQSGIGNGFFVLYGLVRSLKPQVIVETGSARGKSTCALALACRQNERGMVYAIDPHTPNKWSEYHTSGYNLDFLKDRIADYSIGDWCQILQSTSAEVAKSWDKPIDMLWIDGDHTYDGVKLDFELFAPFLKPTAMVVFHDSMWEYRRDSPHYRDDLGVPKFLNELKLKGYQSITLPCLPGMTLLQPILGGFDFVPAELPKHEVFVN